MNQPVDNRPWYKEPMIWLLIAFPLTAVVVASGFTFWLALANPDYDVLEEDEMSRIKSELRANPVAEQEQAQDQDGDDD